MDEATSDRARPAYIETQGRIAFLILNRPEAFNAIDLDMAVRLRHLVGQVDASSAIRVLVIRGAGRAFCGGGDIRHFAANLDDLGPTIRALLTPYHEFLVRLRSMSKLVVASLHGSVAGAGLSLAAMCDLCIAADDTRFTPAYAKLGVSPDGGGTYGLARAVGPRRALQIFLAEDGFSARQAETWGLVNRVVPGDLLADETRRFAERLAATPMEAISNTKRLVLGDCASDLQTQLSDEMESLIRCMSTDAFSQAVRQFVERK